MSMSDLYPVVDDEGFRGFLAELLEEGYIVHPTEVGITRQVVASGSERLTEDQWPVLVRHVLERYGDPPTCKRHGGPVEWQDALRAMQNGGYCPYCYEQVMKDD